MSDPGSSSARYQVLILPADMSPAGRTLLKALAMAALERTFVSSHAAFEFKDVQDFGEVLGFAFRQASMMKAFAGEKLRLLPHEEWDRMEIIMPVPEHVEAGMARDILDVIGCMGELALRARHKPVEQQDPWLFLYAEQTAASNFLYQTGLLLRTGLARNAYGFDENVNMADLSEDARDVLALAHYEHLLTIILNMALRSLVANDERFNAFANAISRISQDSSFLPETPLPWTAEANHTPSQH